MATRGGRSLWYWAAGIVAFNGILAVWLLLKPGGHELVVAVDNVAQFVGPLLTLPLCFGRVARPSTRASAPPRTVSSARAGHRWAPILLGLGVLSQAIGQIIFTCYEQIARQPAPVPSWADVGYLTLYPSLLLGILVLPARTLQAADRLRILVDGLMIIAAAITVSWVFVLGPTILQGGETFIGKVVSAAYPLWDLVLIVCLLILAVNPVDKALRPVVRLLAVALGVIVVSDSLLDIENLHNAYATGELLDVGWPLGFMLVALAAGVLRRTMATTSAAVEASAPDAAVAPVLEAALSQAPPAHGAAGVYPAPLPLWRLLLPYGLVPTLAALLIYTRQAPVDARLGQGVYVGGGVLVALLLLRQVLAVREARADAARVRRLYLDLHALHTNNDALSAANTRLEVMANTDALTGLATRALLHDRVEQAIMVALHDARPFALLLMDLDRFKEVNDTLGHHYGDLLLQQVGPRVQPLVRVTDLVARLGGDEFAILLTTADEGAALDIARAILRGLDAPFDVEGHPIDVGASIGVAMYPIHGGDAETLLRRADVAMYAAKRAQCGVSLYDPAYDGHSPYRLGLMSDLRQALADNTLLLHYQPQVTPANGRLVGVEALLRWPHPDCGFVSPERFIPQAEQTGLIVPITYWALETAIRQAHLWRRQGLDLTIAVNLSARVLHDTTLPGRLEALLRRYDVAPERLTLEITESTLMADPARALGMLTHLADLGMHVSIDDFGTGYSSLGYLKNLPVDEVKIDRSFVVDTTSNAKDAALVRSIVAMAHALGLSVVAEGVETADTWDLLRTLGCDVAQGYYLSRPLAPADLERWIHASPWGTARLRAG